MMVCRLIVFSLGIAAAFAATPRAVMEPAEPQWGDRVRLIYRSAEPGAKLARNQQAMALVHIWFDGRYEEHRLPMDPADEGLAAELTIPREASYIAADFVTRDASDGRIGAMIRDAGGIPARSAWLESITKPSIQKDYRERADKELALYPDNWAVYRDKWFAAGAYDSAGQKAMVAADLEKIETGATGRPEGALYAMSYGYLLLGKEAEARALVHEMVERFPNRHHTDSAISSYLYQGFVQHFDEVRMKEVGDWGAALYRAYPDSILARHGIDTYGVASRLTTDIIEAVCKPWMTDEPENPTPYFQLAEAWRKAASHTQEAFGYAVRAVDLIAAGELRLHGDV